MNKEHLEHLNKIGQQWAVVYSNLLILNDSGANKVDGGINPYIAQLALLPVSKKSVFRDMLWDYDAETSNRAASVNLTKVQLDFGNYIHIPLGVITEMKCLFLFVYASPKDFGNKQNEIKPNTLIDAFKNGLNFLDFTFSVLEKRLGREYVQYQYNKLSEVTLLDFEDAAEKTSLKIVQPKRRNPYRVFFDYLNSHKAIVDIGIESQADFSAIETAYNKERISSTDKDKKEKLLPYLDTPNFDRTLKQASFNVVSFLKALGEKVTDPVMVKYYDILAKSYEEFGYTIEEFNDYGAYRLNAKGYSLEYINTIFPDNRIAKFEPIASGTAAMLNTAFRNKYKYSEGLRLAVNKAYYSALWVIGSLMAARPNVLSDLKIYGCLDLETHTIVSEEHKGRDNRWNLFNDRWVAIPIVVDAIKVVELIGGKVFQNTYVFGNVNTLKPDEVNNPMGSLSITIQNSLKAIRGKSLKDIKSKINGYVFRHSLAHQMFRADVGLPVISYQLKHIVTAADDLARKGKVSETTIGYGGIANQITSGDEGKKSINLRRTAEIELIKTNFNPNGTYLGGKADEHLANIKKYFNGCIQAGYTEEEIYEAMVDQGLAIINVGNGYCFGGVEDFDESLPCIGGLRCNPVRCGNAIVTKANAPKWRAIYMDNQKLIGAEGYEDRQDQIMAVINEAIRVLEYLGEDLV